jgi:hypothetical protein
MARIKFTQPTNMQQKMTWVRYKGFYISVVLNLALITYIIVSR